MNNNSKSFYKESVRKPSDEQSDSVFGDDVAQNYAKSSGGGKFGQFIVSDEDSSDDGAGEMRSFNVPISENYMETGDHLEEDMAMMKSRRDIKSPDIITVVSILCKLYKIRVDEIVIQFYSKIYEFLLGFQMDDDQRIGVFRQYNFRSQYVTLHVS